jgi:hypothetical protein
MTGKSAHPQPSNVGPQSNPVRAQPVLRLHVEALVLHGFPFANRLAIGQAVERELARLFAVNGVPPSLAKLGDIEYIDGRSFDVKPSCHPRALGAKVASAVYEALAR